VRSASSATVINWIASNLWRTAAVRHAPIASGNDSNHIEQVKSTRAQILAGDYSSACQRVQRFSDFPTLAFPATAPICGLAKMRHNFEIASWAIHGIGHRCQHRSLLPDSAKPKFRASALPALGFVNTANRLLLFLSETPREQHRTYGLSIHRQSQ